jgi:hypothetical protein
MSCPYQYRKVAFPDERTKWPDDTKATPLVSAMDRDQLLSLVGEYAGVPDSEIGEQSIHKSSLAQLIVVFEGEDDE